MWIKRHRTTTDLMMLAAVTTVLLLVIPHRQYCEVPKDSAHEYCSFHNALSVIAFDLSDFFSDFGAAITGLATIAIAAFTATLWWTSRATLQHLARQFDAEQRPWMAVEAITPASALTYERPDLGHCWIRLDFALRNTGRTPALQVWPRGKIYFFTGDRSDDPARAQRRFAEEVRQGQTRIQADFAGAAVFPSQKFEQRNRIFVLPDDMKAWRDWYLSERNTPENRPRIKLMLIGCVDYRSPLDESTHQTGFMFEIHNRSLDGSSLFEIDPVEAADVPSERISLSRTRYGSGVTD